MSADNSTDEFSKTHPALGDISNQLGKRGLLLISGKQAHKSRDGHSPQVDDKERDLPLIRKLCQGVENVVKKKCGVRCVGNGNDKGKRACISPPTCIEINSLKGNIISGISKVPCEAKESNLLHRSNTHSLQENIISSLPIIPREDKQLNSSGGILHLGKNDAVDNIVEAGDELDDCCVSSISKAVVSGSSIGLESKTGEGRVTSEVVQSDVLGEYLVCKDGQGVCADNLVSSEEGSVECPRIPELQSSRSFESERCIRLKGNSSNLTADIDMIKVCSCPFCVKAAYIWSDLLYQDTKGRISALQKSQKEADILVQRNFRTKGTKIHGLKGSHISSMLESDLMCQWRALFHSVENTLACETSQLESSLLALKDLRENCKTDLEVINAMPTEKQ